MECENNLQKMDHEFVKGCLDKQKEGRWVVFRTT
jgi:hypothetical protein